MLVPIAGAGILQLTTVIDDFDDYGIGDLPTRWKILDGRALRALKPNDMRPTEYFRVGRENSNNHVEAYTKGEAIQITRPTGDDWRWNLNSQPCFAWNWRALKLPKGAREDKVNDTGGAVYVTYSISRLGLPRSIKYTYSSSLPVGTVVSFRGLKVLVVSTGAEKTGNWIEIQRNVAEDYREFWSGSPPNEPLAVSLWSDSNTSGGEALVHFDDIRTLSSCG